MEQFYKKKGKEGTKGANLIAKENIETLVFYRNMIFGANGIYFTMNILLAHQYQTFDIIMFLLTFLVYVGSFQFMRSMGNPNTTDNGQILDPGVDLNMEGGLAEHSKDLIILTSAVQILSLFSNWFWLLLLLVPGRLGLMLWTNILAPWIFQPAPEEEITDKKRAKMERKMKRSMR